MGVIQVKKKRIKGVTNTIKRVMGFFLYFCMNYLDYVNCVDVCLGVGSGKFIQMLILAENTHKKRV